MACNEQRERDTDGLGGGERLAVQRLHEHREQVVEWSALTPLEQLAEVRLHCHDAPGSRKLLVARSLGLKQQ